MDEKSYLPDSQPATTPPPPYAAVTAQPGTGTVYYYTNDPQDGQPPPPGGPCQYMAPTAQYPQGQGHVQVQGQYPPPHGVQGQGVPQYPPGMAVYPATAPGQPQQMMMPAGQVTTTVVYQQTAAPVSMVAPIVLSCVVLWCCNILVGLAAFIVAMIGLTKTGSADQSGAQAMYKASLMISMTGVLITVVIILVVVLFF